MVQMVDLLEFEVIYSLLKEKAEEESSKDPIDIHYNQLMTDMEVLPKDSEEFKRLVEYVKNAHGAAHTMYELEVVEIFKVARHGEEEQFKSFSLHNGQLLWNGSRTTNFCGIFSQVGMS